MNDDLVATNIKSDGDMYVNFNGPDGDSIIYFFDGSNPTGAFLRFTNSTNSFDLTANIRATQNLWSDNDIYVNHNGGDGDSFLYFYEGGSPTGASLMWDDAPGTFKFSEALDMSSKKITSVLDPTADQDAATKKYVDDSLDSLVVSLYPNVRLEGNWAWVGTDVYIESATLVTNLQNLYIYLTMPDKASSVKVTGQMKLVSSTSADLIGEVFLERKITTGAWTSLGSEGDSISHAGADNTTINFVWDPSFILNWVDGAQYRLRVERGLASASGVTEAYVNIYGVSTS